MTKLASTFRTSILVLCASTTILTSCNNKNSAKTPSNKKNRTYTYRDISSSPSTWNPTDWSTNNESAVITYTSSSLYDFILNDTRDSYEITCEMAKEMPQDVTESFAGNELYGIPKDAKSGYAWKIDLIDNIKWDDGTPINADTFEYSIKQFLNPKMKNYRASNLYMDSLIIANADQYYNGETEWENVGFIKNNDMSFTLVLKKSLSPFMFIYNSGSLMLLKEDLYEANKKEAGDIVKSSYCTSLETAASYGPYKVSSFQPDKSMTFERNPYWYGYSDGRHEGQYQTTNIYFQYLTEHSTVLSLFLKGSLDATALDANDLEKYANSEYRQITPTSYTWKFSLNIDKEALKKQNTDTENHVILSNIDFRKGISLALDRQKYCETICIGSNPMLGLINTSYIADENSGTLYRDTKQAQDILCQMYNTNSVNDITGRDIKKARELFAKAYNDMKSTGDLKDSDKFVLEFHTYDTNNTYMKTVAFLQESVNEASVGTGFEGKITIKQVTDQDYYNNMKKGNADIAMTAWGGSTFDPYGILWCYCTNEALNEYGFDAEKETCTINLNGKSITKSYYDWYLALCNGEYSSADQDIKNTILASCEKGLLSYYNMIPVREMNSNSLISQRSVEGADHFINSLVGRGGIRYLTYTMDDEEWEDYCKKNNYQLQY